MSTNEVAATFLDTVTFNYGGCKAGLLLLDSRENEIVQVIK